MFDKPFRTKLKDKNIILIDDSAYIHRNYFAYRKTTGIYQDEKIEVGAIEGLLNFTDKLNKAFPDCEVIHILDPDHGSDYRKTLFPEYKNRPPKEEELRRQIEILPLVLDGYNQRYIKIDGIESDDILAKYANIYGDENYVMLAAEDKDVWQNIVDVREDGKPGIVFACRYSKNSQGFNNFDFIFSDYINEKFGVKPQQLADYLAFVGDSSDNIPGVKGIGAVAASKLLTTYGNASNIIEAAAAGEIKGKQRENILSGQDNLILSKKLTLPFLDFNLPDISEIQPSGNYENQINARNIVPPIIKWNL